MIRTSGTRMHRPERDGKGKVSKWPQLKENAFKRCLFTLGEERIEILKEKWSGMDTTDRGATGDGDIGDGILLCLRNLGLSILEIRSILPVGGSRMTRLQSLEQGPISKIRKKIPVDSQRRQSKHIVISWIA